MVTIRINHKSRIIFIAIILPQACSAIVFATMLQCGFMELIYSTTAWSSEGQMKTGY